MCRGREYPWGNVNIEDKVGREYPWGNVNIEDKVGREFYADIIMDRKRDLERNQLFYAYLCLHKGKSSLMLLL